MSAPAFHVVSQTAPGRPWSTEAIYPTRGEAESHAAVLRETGKLAQVIQIGGKPQQ